MTGLDLVSAQLRLIGALAPGESPSAQEAQDALSMNNRMLDSWSNEDLLIYSIVPETFQLTAGKSSYTIGSAGDFNTVRPLEIVDAILHVDNVSPALEYPIEVIDRNKWSSIVQKDMQTSYPFYLWAEGTYPLETINLWPVPNTTFKIVIYSLKPLTSIASLTAVLSLPPGYEEAIVYSGAVRLGPEYGRPLSPEIAQIASDSKTVIKRRNYKPITLTCDDPSNSNGPFNIYTGGFRR